MKIEVHPIRNFGPMTRLITPPGILLTTALLAIFSACSFLIWQIERSPALLAGSLASFLACVGTAFLKPWSRFLVYTLTVGFLLKLGSSIRDGLESGFFSFQFGSTEEALKSLMPSAVLAMLSVSCCILVWRQYRDPNTEHPTSPPEATMAGWTTRRYSNEYLWIIATLLALACGNGIQSAVHLNHDVSWIAHSARWLLDGRQFGIDVLDVNPPLIWWLSFPAATLTETGLVSEPTAVRIGFWLYFLTSALLFLRVLSHLEPHEQAGAIGWRIAFVAVATVAASASFGQREYVSVLFAMPYLAMAVLRLEGVRHCHWMLTSAVGLLAGIGFALKPYFLAVPLLVETLLLVRLGWRSVIRIEALVLALAVLVYALLILAFVPQYLSFTVPLMRAVYWAFDTSNFSVVVTRFKDVSEPYIYGLLITLLTRRWTWQHSVLLLAGLGYSISYFIQSKGFVYHAFPVLMCAIAFLGVSLASGLKQLSSGSEAISQTLRFALIAATVMLALPSLNAAHDKTVDWYVQYNIASGSTGRYREAVISLINEHAPTKQTYFMAFSTHPYPGFPSASYTKAQWSGSSATQGIIAAYARRDELTDQDLRGRVVRAAELQRQMVIKDFELRPPSIVLVDRARLRLGMNGREFDDLGFYLEEPQFRRIWREYIEQPPFGQFIVFTRRGDARTAGLTLQ